MQVWSQSLMLIIKLHVLTVQILELFSAAPSCQKNVMRLDDCDTFTFYGLLQHLHRSSGFDWRRAWYLYDTVIYRSCKKAPGKFDLGPVTAMSLIYSLVILLLSWVFYTLTMRNEGQWDETCVLTYSCVPNLPDIPGMDISEGDLCHSSKHSGSDGYAGKKAVVIGFNSSVHGICADLWKGRADVTTVQRSSTHVVNLKPWWILHLVHFILKTRLQMVSRPIWPIWSLVPWRKSSSITPLFAISDLAIESAQSQRRYLSLRSGGWSS